MASRLRLTSDEKIGLFSNMYTMYAAGVPLLEVINSLLEDSKGNEKKILETMAEDLSKGNHIYTSVAKFPHVFSKATINLIKAAEESGNLETTLQDLTETAQKEHEFNDKVQSAMTYPLIVMSIFTLVLGVILFFVVPRVATIFERMRIDLPLPTRLMIMLSNFITNNTIGFIVGGFLVAAFMLYMFRAQKKTLLAFMFKLPIVSDLVKEIDLTRFSRTLYLLLESGLPIAKALELSHEVVSRQDIGKVIIEARELVLSGQDLSDSLQNKKKLIPTTMLKLIEVGEKSGTLSKSMRQISDTLDYKVSKKLASATALLEPIMLVAVGICVGLLMISIIAPIYGLIGTVGEGL